MSRIGLQYMNKAWFYRMGDEVQILVPQHSCVRGTMAHTLFAEREVAKVGRGDPRAI